MHLQPLKDALDFICDNPQAAQDTISTLLVEKYGSVAENVDVTVFYLSMHKAKFEAMLNLMEAAVTGLSLTATTSESFASLILQELGTTISTEAAWNLIGQTIFGSENPKVKLFRLARTIQELG